MKLEQNTVSGVTPMEAMFRCAKCGNQLQVAKALRLLIRRMASLRASELQVVIRDYERMMIKSQLHTSHSSGENS